MTPPLTRQEAASVIVVSQALRTGLTEASNAILAPLFNDPQISPVAVALGIVQFHVDGLASALSVLETDTRDRLIETMPRQLRANVARGQS